MLKNSRNIVVKLREYLIAQGKLRPEFPLPALIHDEDQDERNLIDPRVFCYCAKEEPHIFCTQELENLPIVFRVGILLHEIGHLALHAFQGDESEVDVDSWILESVPEAEYVYEDCFYLRNKSGTIKTKAENLERVSDEFAKEVMMNDYSGDY